MSKNIKINKDNSYSKISRYNWVNIEVENSRVGKARIFVSEGKLIINSINIFPEFERNGYARSVIDFFKNGHNEIVADRVRDTAKGFWDKMGFIRNNDGNYFWRKV